MKAVLGFACLVVAAVVAVAAADLGMPVDSLEAVQAAAIASGPAGTCDGELILGARVVVGELTFTFLTDGKRFVLYGHEQTDERRAWLGTVGPEGQLVAAQRLPFKDLVAQFPSPCEALGLGGRKGEPREPALRRPVVRLVLSEV